MHGNRFRDLSGRKFGRLRVVIEAYTKDREVFWLCQCECGNTTTVLAANLTKKGGHTTSCGCLRRAAKTHGHMLSGGRSPEITAFHNATQRCHNKRNPAYRNYGGKGVRMCRRWRGKNGFVHFLEDLGKKPTPKHSLGRLLDRGNYEPGNVFWSTPEEQALHRRINNGLRRWEQNSKSRPFGTAQSVVSVQATVERGEMKAA